MTEAATAAAGVHSGGVYPPLAVPPGPPDGTEDPEVDRRFERRMWWLVVLLLLLALLLTVVNFAPGPAWAEMPTDRALLTADRGTVTATIDDRKVTLGVGDRRYVDEGARIQVSGKSTGRLTFQGGAAMVLCAGAETQVGRLYTDAGRVRVPHGGLSVDNGRLLADTSSTSGAYEPLELTVNRGTGVVTNSGAAWYAVEPNALTAASGRVYLDGTPSMATGADLTCGDGVRVEPPAGSPSESPSEEPSVLPSEVVPSVTPSATPSAEETVEPEPTVDPVNPTTTVPTTNAPPPTTTRPTTRPPTSRPPTSTRPTTRPPTTPPSTPPSTQPSDPPSTQPSDDESSPPIGILQ